MDREIRKMQDELLLWILRVARYENAAETAGRQGQRAQWLAVIEKIERQRKVNKQFEASHETTKNHSSNK